MDISEENEHEKVFMVREGDTFLRVLPKLNSKPLNLSMDSMSNYKTTDLI